MKSITMTGSMAGLLFLAACTPPSIEPFYTEKNLVRDSGLPGLWQNSMTGEVIQFNADEGIYECRYVPQEGSVARFRAALFELRGQRYLDFYPLDRGPESNALREMSYIPAHILFRVAREGAHLRMSLLDPDWLADKLAGDCSLQYGVTSRGLILTGPTDKIQAFVSRHGRDPAAFVHWSEWRRLPVSVPD